MVVVLYTAGYRYHFKKEKFQKSGGIILEFQPKEVKIYLQDKKIKETGFFDNSHKISDLLPGEYDTTIKKEGYYDWNKKIKVESEKVSFLKDIILFKKNTLPKITINGKIDNLALSPNEDKIFFTEQKEDSLYFKIFNQKINEIISIALFKTTSTEKIVPKFSLNEKRIAFEVNEKNYIYNLNSEELINIEKLFPELGKKKVVDLDGQKIDEEINKIRNIHWNLNSDDALYFINNNDIYQLNLLNYSIKKIAKKENYPNFRIVDFYINGQKTYLIYSNKNKFFLEQWDKNKNEKILLLRDISPDFSFMPCPKPYLTLLDKKDKRLMVINTNAQEIILEESAKSINWSQKMDNNNYKLTYNNDFEINTYSVNDDEKKLITRHSQVIDSVSWIANYSHIVFIHGNSINITDLDENNKVMHTLFQGGEIKNIIASHDGKKTYFKGKIGEQEGIFELDIL